VGVTYAVLKTIAAFLNTEGGDLIIGVNDGREVVGIEQDQFENETPGNYEISVRRVSKPFSVTNA